MSKSAADKYRQRFTSFRDSERVRAGVYYPEAGILWTTWREEAAREALDEDGDHEKAQEQLDAFEAAKAEAAPVVLVPVGERPLRLLREKLDNGDISGPDNDLEYVLACARMPRFDKDDQMVLEGGRPVPGEPLYKRSDLEYLRGDEHLIGGELFQLKMAVTKYVTESAQEASKAAGKSKSG